MLARQIAIGFGIAVIFPLLVYYGVSTIHPSPERPAYVSANSLPPNPEAQRQNQERQEKFNADAKEFARVLVVVSTPLGVAAILIGAYLAFQAIGTGLIFGGILTVAWGYWSYWSYLDNWIRFVSLLAGFAVLIFVGVRRVTRDAPSTAG
jgi:uncharacterized membrane protein YphA (DoxX/SURF4 family)